MFIFVACVSNLHNEPKDKEHISYETNKNRVHIISVLPTAHFNANLRELKTYKKITELGNLALIIYVVQKSRTMSFSDQYGQEVLKLTSSTLFTKSYQRQTPCSASDEHLLTRTTLTINKYNFNKSR